MQSFVWRETKYVPSIESLDIQLSGESLSPIGLAISEDEKYTLLEFKINEHALSS